LREAADGGPLPPKLRLHRSPPEDISTKMKAEGSEVAMLTRRGILAGLLAGVAAPLWAEAPLTSLRPRRRGMAEPDAGPAALVAAAKLTGAVGYITAELATGKILEQEGAEAEMPPASVTKAVTTLFALEKLGVDHRFVTRVMRLGPVVDGALAGDLILAGGGDPELDTDKLGDLVAALAATGLRRVTGRLIIYTGALPERAEIASDQPDYVGYNPSVSGLMLNFNRVNFVWKKAGDGYQIAMNAEGARFVPPVSMATMELVDRAEPLFAYQPGEGVDHWSVARGALGKEGGRWLPVRHAGDYAGQVFRWLASAQGITLPAPEVSRDLPAAAVEILRQESEPLEVILRKMLKYSTNLTAEVVGLTASGAGTQAGSAAVMTAWARRKFGIAATFGDHSGLGPVTRISPAEMMKVMIAARHDPKGARLHDLVRDLPVPDASGKPQDKATTRSHAKSGTMNFVSNLAGYITAPDGRELAFAVFAADLPRRAAVPVWQRESPEGDAAWVKRARRLQQQMIGRWAKLYL
jgi:serine-type D-Ala-D-Ala carboxypeptidase/endopeptidase (penicillin-binding protein 4)